MDHLRRAWAQRIAGEHHVAFPWTEGPLESDRCTETVLMQFGVFGKRPQTGLGVLEALMNNGWTYRHVEVDGEPFRGTVKQFYDRFKEGKFYIASQGHAMAMIDGLLVDAEGRGPDGRKIIGAFEVYRPGERRLAALAYNPETQLPPNKPGTKSVPSGSVRAFHYTWPRNLDSIMRGGLKGSHAQQIDYDGEGIWAAAGVPQGIKDCLAGRESGRIWIEFWTPVDTLYIGGGVGVSASWLEQRNAHIVSPDVPVSHFLGIYLPWHFSYWYIKDDPRTLKGVMEGMHDNLMTDPEYRDSIGKAIRLIKAGK